MGFNITGIKQNIAAFDVSPQNRFDIEIALPKILTDFITESGDEFDYVRQFRDNMIPFRAQSVTLPGAAFLSNETNKFGVGQRIKQPYNAGFSDIRLRFLADANAVIEKTFSLWMNLIFNFSSYNSATATYYSNYRDNIVSKNITITKYTRDGQVISHYILRDAIPTIIMAQEFDWGIENALNTITVGIAYTSFSITD